MLNNTTKQYWIIKNIGGLHNADIMGRITATDNQNNVVAGHGSGNTKNKY